MQFLARLRAERAAVLLLRTQRDISVIGEQSAGMIPTISRVDSKLILA